MFSTRPCIRDGIVAALVILFAILLLLLPSLWHKTGTVLLITTPEETLEYALDVDQTVTVTSGSYTLTVEIRNGAARVTHSNCPDGICISTPAIDRTGESVICAPAGVRLSVKGGDSDVDFVAG